MSPVVFLARPSRWLWAIHTLAHQALDVDHRIGLLLPCNVVVRTDGDHTGRSTRPARHGHRGAAPDLSPIADDAARRLVAALDTLLS
jgi:uncharacterized protein (DUF302 family)